MTLPSGTTTVQVVRKILQLGFFAFATDDQFDGRFAQHGAKAVAIHHNRVSSGDGAEKTIAAIEAAGAKAVTFQADLTSAGAMAKLFANAYTPFHKVRSSRSPTSVATG